MEKTEIFLDNTRKGLILRTFATKPEYVAGRVAQVCETIEIATALRIKGRRAFDRIDIMVFVDTRFGSQADCGLMAAALHETLGANFPMVHIHAEPGDLFCSLLNTAVGKQMLDRVEYSTILSPDARPYLNVETLTDVYAACADGALAAGVALNEQKESVLEGRLVNTFCCWKNEALATAGFFDQRSAMPFDRGIVPDRRTQPLGRTIPTPFPQVGDEEMLPLARLVEIYGPCLAPIVPRGNEALAYEVPDVSTQPDIYERHQAKLRFKKARQDFFLNQAGFASDWLKTGVMEGYRRC